MNEQLYQIFRPVFSGEEFKAALRDAANTRQAHAAATLRKEPESVEFALRNIACLHRFASAQAELFRQVDPAAVEEVGFVSLVLFGCDSRIFQFMLLALNDEPSFTKEAYDRVKEANARVDLNEIVAGNGSLTDALIWLHHMGSSMGRYVVDWTVATSQDAVARAYKDLWNA